jgi:hypothetical protein
VRTVRPRAGQHAPALERDVRPPAPVYSLLRPDGTTTVVVHLKSGKTFTDPVQDNAVLFAAKGLDRITWQDATGTLRSTRATI